MQEIPAADKLFSKEKIMLLLKKSSNESKIFNFSLVHVSVAVVARRAHV